MGEYRFMTAALTSGAGVLETPQKYQQPQLYFDSDKALVLLKIR